MTHIEVKIRLEDDWFDIESPILWKAAAAREEFGRVVSRSIDKHIDRLVDDKVKSLIIDTITPEEVRSRIIDKLAERALNNHE